MPVRNAHHVAVAGRDLLQAYLPGYIGVIERRYTLEDHLPPVTSFVAAAQEDTGTPTLGNTRIFVISPGLADAPEEVPQGGYSAAYALMVGVEVLSRPSREVVDAHLALYQEAIRECILREGSKAYGNVVIDWTDENTDNGDATMALTQGAGITVFSVMLPDVIDSLDSLFPDGPPTDPNEPLPEGPVIEDVEIDTFLYDIEEEIGVGYDPAP